MIARLLVLAVPALILVIPFLAPHQRVGDGSEYIAMYYAWLDTARPWLTSVVEKPYELLKSSGLVLHMIPYHAVPDAFPMLRVNATQDTNHFWLYSGLASLFGLITSRFSIDPTYAFAMLHAALALAVSLVALRLFGLVGVLATTVLFVCSPMLWFMDKMHTEFFTVSLLSIAMLSVMGRRLPWAILALALASAQNINFIAPAGVVGGIWLAEQIKDPRRIEPWGVFIVVAAAVIAIAHPLYYFTRFGGFTPQLIGIGAEIGANPISTALVFIFDPDVGLLPNWPLGLLIIGFGAFALRRTTLDLGGLPTVAFVAFVVATNLLSHSATTALNSGATVHVGRYALWYLPLFLPLMIAIASQVTSTPACKR